MSQGQLSKSRRSLLLVVAAFVIPIVLAKIALTQHWFNYGVTNQGDLLSGERNLSDLGVANINQQRKWLMLVYKPSDCDELCLTTIETIHSTYVALGKEMPRVTPVLLTDSELTTDFSSQIPINKWQVENYPDQAKSLLTRQNILVVDPLSNVVLSHKMPTSADDLTAFGKAILADMKKLLKYSRIG
ncbi:hypothetical protein [Thalassotalea fusca]